MFENCNLSHIFQPNSRTYRKVASEMLQQRITLIQLTSNVQAIRLIITFSWRDFFSLIVPYKNVFEKIPLVFFVAAKGRSQHIFLIIGVFVKPKRTMKIPKKWIIDERSKKHIRFIYLQWKHKKKLDNSFKFYFQLKNDIDKDKQISLVRVIFDILSFSFTATIFLHFVWKKIYFFLAEHIVVFVLFWLMSLPVNETTNFLFVDRYLLNSHSSPSEIRRDFGFFPLIEVDLFSCCILLLPILVNFLATGLRIPDVYYFLERWPNSFGVVYVDWEPKVVPWLMWTAIKNDQT